MKLLLLTQKVDKTDKVLGFFHKWIEEFSFKYEKVTVICLEEGEHSLPSNVSVLSLGKEKRVSKIQYVKNFYSYIKTFKKDYDSVFVHMNQVYVILGGLYWRFYNKKIGLWYVHRQKSWTLKVATYLADTILTSAKESFPYTNPKVIYLGHGIDITRFLVLPLNTDAQYKLLYIGRISRIKNIETLVEALSDLTNKYPNKFRATIVGEAVTENDKKYYDEIVDLVKKRNLLNEIEFKGAVEYSHLPEILKECWATVNPSPKGGMDKVVLESICAGRPAFTSNIIFKGVFDEYASDFIYDERDYKSLVQKIENFLNSSQPQEIMEKLTNKIRENYSLPRLIEKISLILNE